MRIDAYNQVNKIYQANNKLKTQELSKISSTDKVEISNTGKDIQVLTQVLKSTPDIREDKVAMIKDSINNGTYDISDNTFAEKLLEIYNQNI